MKEQMTIGIKDAAARLGISHWVLRKYVREGKVRAVRIGRRVLIEPGELQRLIEQGRTEARQ
jgi:excisionase family DNA binding protein